MQCHMSDGDLYTLMQTFLMKGDATPQSWIVQLLYYLAALGYKSHYQEDQKILKKILDKLD